MKIYTRGGDRGETSLFDNTRVSKADPRVEAYGEVDELNATLGLVRALGVDPEIAGVIERLQRDLHAVGAHLADPAGRIAARVSKTALGDEDVTRLEGLIDGGERELPPLRRFVLSGGCPAGATLHVARTVCRRAERRMVGLGTDAVEPAILTFMNRLSDLLFVLARQVNHRAGVAETEW